MTGSERWLYWTGCAAHADTRIAAVVRAAVRVLRAGGIELDFLGAEESCSGDAARRMGEEGLFQQLALKNIEALQRHGAERVVTHCAHCFHVLKNEYPRFGAQLQVEHHSTLIARLLRQGRLRLVPGASAAAVLHDSCYVGRYNRIFDAPREILAGVQGRHPIEMARHREHSFCCGAGGANYWYETPKAVAPGTLRAREALATGARAIVAECPFCIKMLEQGVQALALSDPPPVLDIAELVADALAAAPPNAAPEAA